jgi:hypothetical protein
MCDRRGHTGPETVCRKCGPQPLHPWEQAHFREAIERAKKRSQQHEEFQDDGVPF